VNGIIEVAGPQQFHLDELVRSTLRERHAPREVITRPPRALLRRRTARTHPRPGGRRRLAETRFEDWLNQPTTGNS
jgi:hypothetical protein